MITNEKLQVYEKYDGDVDAWQRGSRLKQQTITGEDWKLIDDLLQQWHIIRSGQASFDFEKRASAQLLLVADSDDVRRRIVELA